MEGGGGGRRGVRGGGGGVGVERGEGREGGGEGGEEREGGGGNWGLRQLISFSIFPFGEFKISNFHFKLRPSVPQP